MLFHDRKSGSLVSIDHSDILPVDSAVAFYKKHAGEHGEADLPSNVAGLGDSMSDKSRTMPELTNRQHVGLLGAHEELKSRAAAEGVKNQLREAKKAK
jgi:hypothetical protein